MLENDLKAVFTGGHHALLELAMATHAGNTTEEFERIVKEWIATSRHPKTGRLYTVEENPRLCGWGAEISSIVAEEAFWDLDGPVIRITTPHIPLPAAEALEDMAIPSVDRVYDTIAKTMD